MGDGTDLAIVTFGNGTYLSHQAEVPAGEAAGIKARIIDTALAVAPAEDALIQAGAGLQTHPDRR
jgi:2-oxoisovalerate dehydrogenase E1 component